MAMQTPVPRIGKYAGGVTPMPAAVKAARKAPKPRRLQKVKRVVAAQAGLINR